MRIRVNQVLGDRRCIAVGAALAAVLMSALAGAQEDSVDARLARLERLLQTSALADLLTQVEVLEREVKALRGQLEVQSHELAETRQQQQRLFQELQGRTPQGAAAASAAPAPVAETVEPPVEAADGVQAPAEAAAAAPQLAAAPDAESVQLPGIAGDPALEKDTYQRAFNLLKEGRYDESIAEFNNFLVAYPNSEYSDNAQYWLGEAYYVTREFQPALVEYQRLINAYPDSDKRAHAMLKIGYSYHELGQTAEARAVLEELKALYPNSTAARLAQDRLQRIALETP